MIEYIFKTRRLAFDHAQCMIGEAILAKDNPKHPKETVLVSRCNYHMW